MNGCVFNPESEEGAENGFENSGAASVFEPGPFLKIKKGSLIGSPFFCSVHFPAIHTRAERIGCATYGYFLAAALAGAGAADVVNMQGGAVSAVGVIWSGFRLFLVSSALKSERSFDCMVFHADRVVL